MEPALAIDWREQAMRAALDAEASYGDGSDALMKCIRAGAPESCAYKISVDRRQLAKFLQTQTSNDHSMLQGEMWHGETKSAHHYAGWFSAEWDGTPIEIAMAPGCRETLCLGPDRATTLRLVEAVERFCVRPEGRSLRYSEGWEAAPDLDAEIAIVGWEDIVLPPDTVRVLRETAEGFLKNRDAYARFGFPWRRGLLLIGPPGTGKTMVCKAIAASLRELPFLYVRDLRDRDQDEAMRAIFERARQLAPCVLAFEDIDGLVNEQNRTIFLNELDGFGKNEGLLIIASSNHPGKIDEALLKRPSRFDRVLHLGLPAEAERRRYCDRILARAELEAHLAPGFDRAALAAEVAHRTDGFTPAYLKEALLAGALQRAHAGVTVLDEHFSQAVLAQIDELREQMRRLKDPEALAAMTGGETRLGFGP